MNKYRSLPLGGPDLGVWHSHGRKPVTCTHEKEKDEWHTDTLVHSWYLSQPSIINVSCMKIISCGKSSEKN